MNADSDPLEIDFWGCPAVGVGGYHSEEYGEDGVFRCEWCGQRPPEIMSEAELRAEFSRVLEEWTSPLLPETLPVVNSAPTMTPKLPGLDHNILEALTRVPDEVLRARTAPGSGYGLGDVCGAELDRRAAAREVSAVTDVQGPEMILTLRRHGGRTMELYEARDLWSRLDATERLQTIRAYRAYETNPNFRTLVHILVHGTPLCGKPGVPGRWGDGDSWVHVELKAKATCDTCLSALDASSFGQGNFSAPMTEVPPPRWLGTPQRNIDLTRMLFPWREDQPVYIAMSGTTALYLPVFSTAEKLRTFMALGAIEFESIKQIQDGAEFLSSIPTTFAPGVLLHIMIDAYRHESGSTRFTQLLRD